MEMKSIQFEHNYGGNGDAVITYNFKTVGRIFYGGILLQNIDDEADPMPVGCYDKDDILTVLKSQASAYVPFYMGFPKWNSLMFKFAEAGLEEALEFCVLKKNESIASPY